MSANHCEVNNWSLKNIITYLLSLDRVLALDGHVTVVSTHSSLHSKYKLASLRANFIITTVCRL